MLGGCLCLGLRQRDETIATSHGRYRTPFSHALSSPLSVDLGAGHNIPQEKQHRIPTSMDAIIKRACVAVVSWVIITRRSGHLLLQ